MVRITGFLVAGILVGIYQPDFLPTRMAIILLVILIGIYMVGFAFRQNSITKYILGVVGFSSIALVGFLHLHYNTDRHTADHFIHANSSITAYEAIVRSVPESKARSWKLQVDVVRMATGTWKPASGNVLLYLSKRSFETIPWRYGDHLLIRGAPVELTTPANPGEFDYKRFLSFRNIYHQQFLNADQVQFLSSVERKGFLYYSHQVRAWATDVINHYIQGTQAQAIAQALILGVTEGIDTDLQQAYAASGAMHVLAVSGLHVGIIYGILLYLLKPLAAFSWSRWVVAIISIILLWAFAFVTGLSPSVLRAVTMFSFIALARPLGWRTNIYNTLAASAFVLLLYDPYLIMSVGFQLSYLAVLGIVYLQRPIYNLWEVKTRVVDWIWQITCVSIAAQIATFALSMLYFHQFPVYFLVSNLFVIPLSTLVLVGGIILLAVSGISVVASGVGYGLQQVIELLNWLVFQAEELPFSLINNIYLTTFQCWLIMAMLVSGALIFHWRSLKPVLAMAGFGVVLIVTQVLHHAEISDRQFIVYSVTGYSALEFIDGGVSYARLDSGLASQEERVRFHIRPNRLNRGVHNTHTEIPFGKSVANGFQLFSWHSTRIGLVQADLALLVTAELDYLIIGRNAIRNPAQLVGMKAKKIILDGSNSRSYVARWKRWADEYGMEVHPVTESGAFMLTL